MIPLVGFQDVDAKYMWKKTLTQREITMEKARDPTKSYHNITTTMDTTNPISHYKPHTKNSRKLDLSSSKATGVSQHQGTFSTKILSRIFGISNYDLGRWSLFSHFLYIEYDLQLVFQAFSSSSYLMTRHPDTRDTIVKHYTQKEKKLSTMHSNNRVYMYFIKIWNRSNQITLICILPKYESDLINWYR